MNRRTYAAFGALAVAALTLTACSSAGNGPSYQELGTGIESGGQGKVTLVDDFTSIKDANVDNSRTSDLADSSNRSGAGANSTAELKVTADYTRGNWKIEGSWRDGAVKFKFTGWAQGSEDVQAAYQIFTACYIDQNCPPLSRPRGADEPRRNDWVKGGCIVFPSYYASTNPTYPGTGVVYVTFCDVGTGSSIAGGAWAGQDLIQLRIPDSSAYAVGDASPYRLYVGGGTLKNSALSVRTKYDGSSPTATPTPPWITPTPTSDGAPVYQP